MDKYDNLGIIGEGSYGVVIKCKHTPACTTKPSELAGVVGAIHEHLPTESSSRGARSSRSSPNGRAHQVLREGLVARWVCHPSSPRCARGPFKHGVNLVLAER